MLVHLSIRDIVLIERLDIEFQDGLSVLTGETGAGKSILLDALSLALGSRGDATLVREGAEQGQVIAAFSVTPNHPSRALLRDNGIDDDGDLILRRTQSADGRTRVFVNDQPASVALMKAIGSTLVELHGQHDERALVDPTSHCQLLDAFGGHIADVDHVGKCWRDWREAEGELSRHKDKVEAAQREAEFLRASVHELNELDPQPGEEEELAERRAFMMRAEKVADDIADAQEILNGAQSPVPSVAGLLRRLERKAESVPGIFDDIIEALTGAVDALAMAQQTAERAALASEFDPHELETTEERLFALRAAARKHSVAVENLAALRDEMVANLADLDAGAERLLELERIVVEKKATYEQAASKLSGKRHLAALELRDAVEAELPALRLENASFIVAMAEEPARPSENGIDTVEFYVRTNPGTKAGPIGKVASGGELSRFLLALKVALADRGSAPTLVFDEIDTGVGGAVADAIGQRLKRLASRVQVLSVTHAPQVAARAINHYLISKAPKGPDRIATGVLQIGEDERLEEIARMLSGETITIEARAAAGRLLQQNAQLAS
jgi:DNA repair protein RecN (Recombination protein N)